MKRHQNGGVSLFIVIFTALIVTIITISFTKFMISNQRQTSQNDLSQRAYNSAIGGVEDAKRVLVRYAEECKANSAACTTMRQTIDKQSCDTVSQIISNSDKEVQIGAEVQNQAYTCVKIQTNTPNYQLSLAKDQSAVVPLKSASDFNAIRITWFKKPKTVVDDNVNYYQQGAVSLPQESQWQPDMPPILRAQLIPGSVAISSLDSNARTAFLYPIDGGGGSVDLNSDQRRASGAKTSPPQLANCATTYSSASTAGVCKVTLSLPKIGATRDTKSAYLQLAALYNATDVTIELLKDNTVVNFDGVQPLVDSTGRADDLFRRVEARIKIGGVALPYPDATINVKGNFCKAFTLRDATSSYDPGTCEPAG